MKKHLIAAAVAAAVAVPAAAQVTISGNIEAGYTSKDVRAVGSTTTNTKQSAITGGHFGTPNVMFSGTEDLGGGLKASFTLNREYNMTTGLDTTTGFNQAFIGLSGSFGTVQVGKLNHATRDAGGVYRFFGDIGRLAGSMNSGADQQNTIQYISPTISGFTVSVANSDIDETVASGATTNVAPASLTSYGVRGKIGEVNLSLGRETNKFVAASAGAGQAEWDLDTLAANIDLGAARVGVVVAKQDLSRVGGANGGKRDATGFHVAVPMGAVTLGGSFTNYEVSEAAGGAKPKAEITAIAARYNFSKRTALLASYQTVKNSGAADALGAATATDINGTVAGSSRGLGVVETTNKTASGMGLTVVHTF